MLPNHEFDNIYQALACFGIVSRVGIDPIRSSLGVPRMQACEALGYSDSKRFYGPKQVDDLPANELSFALRLADAECAKMGTDVAPVRFEGVYVLQREPKTPAVPVVFVVQVNSDAVARRVHQFVWNQNQSPFLLLESRTTIRLYPGFNFHHDDGNPLVTASKDIAEVLQKLAAFRADSIDDGTLWKQWAHAVDPSKRVDEALLRDLESLDKRLQGQGVDRNASHGLIGKFVYLRYLRDREILSDKKLARWQIDPDHLFTRKATRKAFWKVNDELQTWLNGSVFSLGEAELADITAPQLQLVAGVFGGASPVGKDAVQPSLFDPYNFAHISIETLSSVYEQFLHDAKEDNGRSRGKTLGAYYTPLPLADYVLTELETRHPLNPGMKVLDPACGSGTFLVQCYRRLIEKQRRAQSRKLKKKELKDLLTKHIFGVDRDDDACRVAELSLILTLLDYVEPPDLEGIDFQLPCLRGQNIFGPWKDSDGQEHKVDFFDESGPVHDLLTKQRFDWIVGNPPWAEVKGTPTEEHEHYVAHQWMKSRKTTHPTSANQIAEAFIWKASEHLAPDGVCGLVVLAMTWFKHQAAAFRQRFFAERRVWCLANLANLAEVLFAKPKSAAAKKGPRRGASVVFFEEQPPEIGHVILSFAPFVAEQLANRPEESNQRLSTWNIVVGESELREIENKDALLGTSLTWKFAMWGTSRDRKLLHGVAVRTSRFGAFAKAHSLNAHEGFRLQNANRTYSRPSVPVEELRDKQRVIPDRLRSLRNFFEFPPFALEDIPREEQFVPKGRAKLAVRTASPPHILLDAARRYAVYSNDFLVIPAPNISIKGPKEAGPLLRALSLYLSSRFCTYHQFFFSHQWGVDTSRAELRTLRDLPVPFADLSIQELTSWSELYQDLVRSTRGLWDVGQPLDHHEALLDELNKRVYNLLKLRTIERWLVDDFVLHHLELNQGKVSNDVIRTPTPAEMRVYLGVIRDCLDDFLSTNRGLRHNLEVLADHESALLSVSLIRSKAAVEPIIFDADAPAARNLKVIREQLRSKHSQWIYFDRGLKVYQRGVLYQFKPLQRLHWTRRQAVLDADDIIAETLADGGGS